jgi:hypothetical protein
MRVGGIITVAVVRVLPVDVYRGQTLIVHIVWAHCLLILALDRLVEVEH